MVIGRYIYAVGGTEKASVLSGINVVTGKILVFVICGMLSSLAGIILASRMGSAQATGGAEWTLPAIASAVIGGVSLSGGKGKIYGAIIGSALMGIINNILVLLHISSYWQTLISGLIVLGAVMIDSTRKNR
jgi:ribose/xylose/arabinose/galactoside ABC-type transport system permease subunit